MKEDASDAKVLSPANVNANENEEDTPRTGVEVITKENTAKTTNEDRIKNLVLFLILAIISNSSSNYDLCIFILLYGEITPGTTPGPPTAGGVPPPAAAGAAVVVPETPGQPHPILTVNFSVASPHGVASSDAKTMPFAAVHKSGNGSPEQPVFTKIWQALLKLARDCWFVENGLHTPMNTATIAIKMITAIAKTTNMSIGSEMPFLLTIRSQSRTAAAFLDRKLVRIRVARTFS
ncbi:hypothetical protein HY477_01330 [Candidatus Uhrbacteria bacterium]|nr:hypothetical protein [Candidatus Uhrbacteria bacterium]